MTAQGSLKGAVVLACVNLKIFDHEFQKHIYLSTYISIWFYFILIVH